MRTGIFLVGGLLLTSSTLVAQLFQARFVTSGLAWQRQDTIGQSSNHFYGHQTIQFSLAGKHLSLHAYVQGFNDLAGPVKYEPQFRLYNFYLKASNLADMVDVSLGRQTVFAGVGVGSMDGGLVLVRVWESKIRFLGYYGLLPPPQQKVELIGDKKNNFMTGGQVMVNPIDAARFSVSYLRRNILPEAYSAIRRDSLFNPYRIEIRPSASTEEYLSGDLDMEYAGISGYARYDYDMKFEKTARLQLFTRVKVLEQLGVTGEYIYREPRLSYNTIFSVFAYNTLNEYEVGLEYAFNKSWSIIGQVFGKYGSVSYGDDETTQRITLGASGHYGALSVTHNLGYAGELSGASISAGYPLFERTLTPTLLLSYARYKLSENAELENALSVALGAVYRPRPALSLDTQLQWIQNKIYQNDVRLLMRVSYVLSQQLNLF